LALGESEMRPRIPRGEQEVDTYLSLGDEDFNSVIVRFEVERPEPDVGFAGGIIVNSVMLGDKDLMVEMSERDLSELETRLTEELYQYNEEY